MQSIEITGKSVAEATEAAASKLGVPADQLTVTVLEETKGLFGKSTVRIKAEAKEAVATPAAPEAKAPAKGRSKKAAVEAPVETAPEPEPEPEAVEAPAAEEASAAESKGRGRGRNNRGRKDESAPTSEDAAASGEATEEGGESSVQATQEDADKIVGLIRDLMEKADLTVKVESKDLGGRYVTIELDGKDAAYLVGKQGEVLNATQYLVNIIAGRRFNNGVRATLDGNNYRRRREARLEAMATQLADQVKARGEEAVLDALPAFERRIVHKVLSTMEGISTYSEGEEPNRRVVIAPAD